MSNITKVYFMNVPLENDYKNTLYFSNASTQLAYFNSLPKKAYSDFTYQRKDNVIRVPEQYDRMLGYNYVMYQNTAYSNKWFYAFITDIQYINDARTDVHIETDVMQTWLNDYTVLSSFVEREHTDNDSIGSHTLDEGLEKGEYIVDSYSREESLREGLKVVIGSTVNPHTMEAEYGGLYGGIYSGVRYYAYDNADAVTSVLQALSDEHIDAVSSVFLAPDFLVKETSGPVANSDIQDSYGIYPEISIPTSFGDYKPKNNKLLTYPYTYMTASNANGSTAIYHFELFSDRRPWFGIIGCLTPGCSIRLTPIGYKDHPNDYYDEGINLGKYPQCNWATDPFTNWLTQNGVNVATSLISGGVSAATGAVGGFMMGGPLGGLAGGAVGAASGAAQIASTLAEVNKADMIAPQVSGNINNGDVCTAYKMNTFHFRSIRIKEEYARIIDEYFDMFGYKCHRVKVPLKAHRASYWYTKCIDVNITGAIPMHDLNKIKACYNNGITFWRSASNIKNYAVNNEIV